MTSAEVLVVRAGLGGCATALSIAQVDGQVVLVGPWGSPDRGLSGEWLHPAGVTTLQRLGVRLHGADFTQNHGFRNTVDLAKWLLWLCGPDAGTPPTGQDHPAMRLESPVAARHGGTSAPPVPGWRS